MAESSLSLSVTTAHPLSKSEIEKRSSGENPHFSLKVDLPAKKSNKPNRETCYFNTTNNSLSHSSLTTEGNHSTVLNIEKVSKVEGSDQFGYVISTKFLEDHYLQVTDRGSKKRDVRFTTKKSAKFHESQLFKLAQDPKTEARFALYTSVVDGKGRNKICYLRYEDGSIIAEESSSADKYHCFIFTEMNLQTKGATHQISPKQLTPYSENRIRLFDKNYITTSDHTLWIYYSDPLSAREVLQHAEDGNSLFLVRFPDVDDQYAFGNSTVSGDYPLEYRELTANPNLNYLMGFSTRDRENGVLWDTVVTSNSFYTAQPLRPAGPQGSLSAAFISTERAQAPLWTVSGSNRYPTYLSFRTTVNNRVYSVNPTVARRSSEVVVTFGRIFTMEVFLVTSHDRNTLPASPIRKEISSELLEDAQPETNSEPHLESLKRSEVETGQSSHEDFGSTVISTQTTTLTIMVGEIEAVITHGPPLTAREVLNLAVDDEQFFIVRFPPEVGSRFDDAYVDTTNMDLRYREAPGQPDLSILMKFKRVETTDSVRWSTLVTPQSFLQLSRLRQPGSDRAVEFVGYDDPTQAPVWTVLGERPESTELSLEGRPDRGTGGSYSIIALADNIVAAIQNRSYNLQVLHVTSFPASIINPSIN